MSALKIPVFVSLLVQTLMVLTNVAVPLDMCCEPTRKHVQMKTNVLRIDITVSIIVSMSPVASAVAVLMDS